MFKALVSKISNAPIFNLPTPDQEKLWQANRVIAELTARLEAEQEAHRRTRNVYRNVINQVKPKIVDIDVMVSREAKRYDEKRK